MSFVSRSDAVVALRSFGRRYSDVLVGPPEDDAWARLVRKVGVQGHSALGFVALAVAQLDALAHQLQQASSGPVAFDSPALVAEPGGDVSTASLQSEVRRAATGAGDALDAKRDDDYDRFSDYVSGVVTELAANVRKAQTALDAARD